MFNNGLKIKLVLPDTSLKAQVERQQQSDPLATLQ